MYKYTIIYQKRNGLIFTRRRKTLPLTNIYDETSMGWKILDIFYYNRNNMLVSLGQGKTIA